MDLQIQTVVGDEFRPLTTTPPLFRNNLVKMFLDSEKRQRQHVLFIASRGPLFKGYPRLDFKIPLDLWIGGEGANIPHVEEGDPRGLNREQIFALREGERIIVVDCDMHIGVVMVACGKLVLYAANESDLTDHVLRRAPYMKQVKELRWGLRALRALGEPCKKAEPLAELIRKKRLDPLFVLTEYGWKNAIYF